MYMYLTMLARAGQDILYFENRLFATVQVDKDND